MANQAYERGPVGISLGGGNAAPFPVEGIPAIIALAEAIRANADAVSVIARRFEGTPAVQGASITGCSINMATPPKATAKPRKKRAKSS